MLKVNGGLSGFNWGNENWILFLLFCSLWKIECAVVYEFNLLLYADDLILLSFLYATVLFVGSMLKRFDRVPVLSPSGSASHLLLVNIFVHLLSPAFSEGKIFLLLGFMFGFVVRIWQVIHVCPSNIWYIFACFDSSIFSEKMDFLSSYAFWRSNY